jgi:hypothetical protein
MKRISFATGLLLTGLGSTAYADIPAGYKGTPFNPATAGGTCAFVPPSVPATAGPYTIPGRLELPSYDMGGLNVGFFTTDHDKFAGNCYRTDNGNNEASLSATSSMKDQYSPNGDVWYDTGDPTVDGTLYPNAMQTDVYIGAVRPGDWVNITVNVMTAGTYLVSSTWASGNGNPGGEGGNGDVELQVSVNGTMMLDWKDVFPNYNTTADFHHWKPYPNMGTVTLQEGMQVFKLLSVDPHLNLDYIEFELLGADGGVVSGGSGTSTATSGSPSSGTSTSGTTAAAGATSGGGSGSTGASGSPSSGSTIASGEPSGSNVGSGATTGNQGGSAGTQGNPGSGVGAGTGTNSATSGVGGGAAGAAVAANSSSSGSKGCAFAADAPLDSRSIGSAWILGLAAVLISRSRRFRYRA